jgi:tRNA-dihydrouridine synthase A
VRQLPAAPPRLDRRLSVAPMMDWTDRHCRYFLRLIAPRALLYTEMIPTGAILRGDRVRFLAFDPAEHPLALQLGGADPGALAACAAIAEAAGYDEVNLNLGCPSERVQSARFGACLMAEPLLVARCVAAMREATRLPVTVKTRIGIDEREDFAFLLALVDAIAAAGCRTVIVHARKAWLTGLSPKENREIPPLRHEVVHRLKSERPGLEIVLNGGIVDLQAARAHLEHVDGVMIGRAAYQNPACLAAFEAALLGPRPPLDRFAVARAMLAYAGRAGAKDVPLPAITRHMLGLFNGLPGARAWRHALSEEPRRPGAGPEVIEAALAHVARPAARSAASSRAHDGAEAAAAAEVAAAS